MNSSIEVFNADCLDILSWTEDNSVDALVTDPPAGIGFMGKSWDSDKGGRKEWIAWLTSVMQECRRVLKPGAHGLIWAIPRTSHWTATALEDAGLEVRDVITHLFGQGFPKSLNISKAIDKANGDERPVLGKRTDGRYAHKFQDGNNQFVNAENNARKEVDSKIGLITAPASAASAAWEGWGTALKPAAEFWWLVRKPCSEKTVAANVLKWGTGGINIDGGRIEAESRKVKDASNADAKRTTGEFKARDGSYRTETPGRFPANLVLSHSPYCEDDQCDMDCAVRQLDGQSGALKSGKLSNKTSRKRQLGFGMTGGEWAGDSGGASRFFYCGKISPGERALSDGTKSTHPTVKPLKLMRYLCRLITPPNGVILDPFMGSGSTGVAALQEGFKFVGIEREAEYHAIAEKRLSSVKAKG